MLPPLRPLLNRYTLLPLLLTTLLRNSLPLLLPPLVCLVSSNGLTLKLLALLSSLSPLLDTLEVPIKLRLPLLNKPYVFTRPRLTLQDSYHFIPEAAALDTLVEVELPNSKALVFKLTSASGKVPLV